MALQLCVVLYNAGSNVTPSRSELLQDVRHLVWRSRHPRASVCLPELVGTHDSLSRHHCHGPRWQQRSCDTAENCTRSGSTFFLISSAYGCIDFSCYFRRAQFLGRLARPESAAAQRWSSTIGCPAWQMMVERSDLAILKTIIIIIIIIIHPAVGCHYFPQLPWQLDSITSHRPVANYNASW